jgi:uncharacterized cupin superfamily protein
MNVDAVQAIDRTLLTAFVPPVSDYDHASDGWQEAEYRAFETANGSFGGYWTGEPGEVSFANWPYNEICLLVKGKVALVDREGGRREFTAGQAFFVPAGFAGRWVTVEPSEKYFIAIMN